jgi:transposase-like protein
MMDVAEHEVLTFMDFAKEHRVKIHSTNVLERLNGEIKRRADVVGIFPNEASIRRLVGALLLEQNDEYAIQKRYMSLESLASMSDNPPIRLPASPALA